MAAGANFLASCPLLHAHARSPPMRLSASMPCTLPRANPSQLLSVETQGC